MIRKVVIAFGMICCGFFSFGQENHSIHDCIQFSDFLISNKLYDDCTLLLKHSLNQPEVTTSQKDTLFLKLGQVYFKKNTNDSAVISFNTISQSSVFFTESRFYKSYILSCENKFSESRDAINEIKTTSASDTVNKQLYLAGISLLMRDTAQFRKTSTGFVNYSTEMDLAQNKLNTLYHEIKKAKHKSGLLAGTLSALVPGAGKIYAGKIRQGVTTFLPVAIMGAQVFEAYKVGGINSARFYIYSGLFSVFYIGNIWGSVLSVSVCRNEFNKEINDQVLFTMRIPVQKLFR
jgi:TM2 domain-containing membrane protein YozV